MLIDRWNSSVYIRLCNSWEAKIVKTLSARKEIESDRTQKENIFFILFFDLSEKSEKNTILSNEKKTKKKRLELKEQPDQNYGFSKWDKMTFL